jgi:GNAT superfamily N-acetyltransferase
MPVERFKPTRPRWDTFLAHLERVEMTQHALEADGSLHPDKHVLGMRDGQEIVGHITFKKQAITIPATEWSGKQETLVMGKDDAQIYEAFTQTFAVDKTHRRLGYGRALQLAALDLARELGCYQLRSWSSLDQPANHALKLSLGFSIHPAKKAAAGQLISGAYFVRTVQL